MQLGWRWPYTTLSTKMLIKKYFYSFHFYSSRPRRKHVSGPRKRWLVARSNVLVILCSPSFPPFNRLPSLGSHFPALILPPKKRPPPNLSHLLPRIHHRHVPCLVLWTPESIGSFLRHLIKIYLCFFSSLMSNIC